MDVMTYYLIIILSLFILVIVIFLHLVTKIIPNVYFKIPNPQMVALGTKTEWQFSKQPTAIQFQVVEKRNATQFMCKVNFSWTHYKRTQLISTPALLQFWLLSKATSFRAKIAIKSGAGPAEEIMLQCNCRFMMLKKNIHSIASYDTLLSNNPSLGLPF